MKTRPSFPSPFQFARSSQGMTLIELMIVVAIIGVLAGIAIVSYGEYVNKGRMTELRQYAMDIKRGQEQYFSRNHEYFQPSTNVYDNSTDDPEWSQLLEFNAQTTDETVIAVEAGAGGSCTICGGVDPTEFHDTAQAWFGVRVYDEDLQRSIILTSEHDRPVEVNGAWNP